MDIEEAAQLLLGIPRRESQARKAFSSVSSLPVVSERPPSVASRDTDMDASMDGMEDSKYCRKDKSLAVLCENFLKLYEGTGKKEVWIDRAAEELNVERRRIYDIVNVLEAVNVVAKQEKNVYRWNGLSAIPAAVHRIGHPTDPTADSNRLSTRERKRQREERDVESEQGSSKPLSLCLLTKLFVRLFLSSGTISLEKAAETLWDVPGQDDNKSMRTKVRRLYDIANVLGSINLVEKMHTDARKPGFRWCLNEKENPVADEKGSKRVCVSRSQTPTSTSAPVSATSALSMISALSAVASPLPTLQTSFRAPLKAINQQEPVAIVAKPIAGPVAFQPTITGRLAPTISISKLSSNSIFQAVVTSGSSSISPLTSLSASTTSTPTSVSPTLSSGVQRGKGLHFSFGGMSGLQHSTAK